MTNANSDAWFHPRHVVDDNAGANIEYADGYAVYDKVCIADNIKVTIAGANADDSAEVGVVYYAGAYRLLRSIQPRSAPRGPVGPPQAP